MGILDAPGVSPTRLAAATLAPAELTASITDSLTYLTRFAPGHGWAASGSGGSVDLNNTEMPFASAQSVKIVTGGTGSANREIEKTGLTLDMTGKDFVLWVKCLTPDPTLNVVRLTVGDSGYANNWQWNWGTGQMILQFEGWVGYQFSFGSSLITLTGSPNRAAINSIKLRIREVSTPGHPVTAYIGGLATRPALFPNGVVCFTFDDSEPTGYTHAAPILAEKGFAATAFIETDFAEGRLTEEQAHDLERVYGWEVGGHCTSEMMHVDFTALPVDELRAELTALKTTLVAKGFRGRDLFATPRGVNSATVREEAKKLFSCLRTTAGGGPFVSAPPTERFNIEATGWDSAGGSTLAGSKALVDIAKANGTLLILNFHRVEVSLASTLSISVSDFTALVAYVAAQGVAVRTLSQVLNASIFSGGPA